MFNNVISLLLPYLIALIIPFVIILAYSSFMIDLKLRAIAKDLKVMIALIEKNQGNISSGCCDKTK